MSHSVQSDLAVKQDITVNRNGEIVNRLNIATQIGGSYPLIGHSHPGTIVTFFNGVPAPRHRYLNSSILGENSTVYEEIDVSGYIQPNDYFNHSTYYLPKVVIQ